MVDVFLDIPTLCEKRAYISSVGKVEPITDMTSNKYILTVSFASEIFHIILIKF